MAGSRQDPRCPGAEISVLGDEEYYPNLVVWSDVALQGKYDKADLLEMIRKGARIYLDQFGLISSLQ